MERTSCFTTSSLILSEMGKINGFSIVGANSDDIILADDALCRRQNVRYKIGLGGPNRFPYLNKVRTASRLGLIE